MAATTLTSRRSYDIAGYTYRADNYCPPCIIREIAEQWWAPGAEYHEPAEHYLNRAAGKGNATDGRRWREDERSFDSGDFPKVVFVDQLAPDETCGRCGGEL